MGIGSVGVAAAVVRADRGGMSERKGEIDIAPLFHLEAWQETDECLKMLATTNEATLAWCL